MKKNKKETLIVGSIAGVLLVIFLAINISGDSPDLFVLLGRLIAMLVVITVGILFMFAPYIIMYSLFDHRLKKTEKQMQK